MIKDATTKISDFDGKKRLEVFIPRYGGVPLFMLDPNFNGRPVKLFSDWADLPATTGISINGSPIRDEYVGQRVLMPGMVFTIKDHDVIYIMTPRSFLV